MRLSLPRCVATFVASVALVCAASTMAFATELTVAPKNSDAYSEIQAQLDTAKKNATTSNPYTVRVAKGTYTVGTCLHIYGNTTLVLDGVTLNRAASYDGNLIKIGDRTDTQTGYSYKNIKISGGTNGGVLDGNGRTYAEDSPTVLKGAHAQNFVLEKMTVRNAYNGHLMEVAGINGMQISNCTFKDQILDKDHTILTPEAIQIDVLVERHFNGYAYEDLPMKNVTVTKCAFSNVPRGVGSHSAILNNYVNGVTITNNTFTNMGSAAVQGMNYINCTIADNVITNSPRGIALYTINTKGTFFGKTATSSSSTSSKYLAPPSNQNIEITGNKITVNGTEQYTSFTNEGIIVYGVKLTSALKSSAATDAIPKGDYYASGVTISGNTISSTGHGIRLNDVRNASIGSNSITYSGSKTSSTDYYGIQALNGCQSVSISKNTIKNARTNGIFILDSKASSITGNKITSPGKYGIGVQSGTASKITSNTVSKAGTTGIFLMKGSKATTIKSNKISSPKQYGIYASNSTISSISSNTITSAKTMGVMIKDKSKVKKITSNKIKCASKSRGIGIYAPKCSMNISKNKVSECKNWAIYVDGKSKSYKITVKSNNLSGAKNYAKVKVASGKVTVSGSKKA